MCYLKGTTNVGLVNGDHKDNNGRVVGNVDLDYVRDLYKKKPLTGYGSLATEAEYIATTEAMKEAIWFQGLVGELGISSENTIIFCDSQSAIHLSEN